MHWKRKWQPTPVLLPGESQGWGSLVGCRLWGCTVGHDSSDLAAARASLVAQAVKNLPAMQETWVQSLGQEDPLEKGMATHLPGVFHGQRSLVGCSPWGPEESDMTERLHFNFSLSCIGEGNGNPLQCSCLENPRDGGAWWAAVYGVAQSDMTEAT